MFKEKKVKKAEKVYAEKKSALVNLIVLVFICSPIMIFLVGTMIYFFFNGDFPVIIVLLLFFGYIYWEFINKLNKYSIVLFQEQSEIFIKNNASARKFFKPPKAEGTNIEGIISKEEKKKIDSDNDGHILVSEFYTLTEDEVNNNIVKVDSAFSKTEFYSFVKNVFILFQNAMAEMDFKKLRAYEADALYYRHKEQIENCIQNGDETYKTKISIKGVLLKDFKIEGSKEYLVVAITANIKRMYSYYFYEDDLPYIMVFSRNKGVKTCSKLSTTNCSNCGAVINVNDDGVCNYCNTSLVSGETEWVLIDIKQINLIDKKKRD